MVSICFAMLPVALTGLGLPKAQLGLHMALLVFAGLLLQPAAAVVARTCGQANPLAIVLVALVAECGLLLLGVVAATAILHMLVLGSLVATLYPLSLGLWSRHGGQPGGKIMAAYAVGGFCGPLLCALAMDLQGPTGLFSAAMLCCLATLIAIAILVKTRKTRVAPAIAPHQASTGP
ncbi:hypothetical protein [Biformimicrobium ophioploci]|uniref:MFS transporter n=1 Tax=Biformimicrobium ophioploci TaxID=3036711 RepID=A0ABQ6M0V9_9GAMM|nr:hypothetical protein [Microbulbifer sp. NKW57]GMG87946.1 hypothetical protein MNKW57_22670 [Microbulbifer sp. NKW57]